MEDPESAEARSAGPRVPGRRLGDIEYAAAARRRAMRGIGLGVIALGVLAVLVAIVGRDSILAMWPSTAGVYQTFGLTEAADSGLEVSVTPQRTVDSFIVQGDIVNHAAVERRLPRLRLSLYDGKAELEAKTVDPPAATLPAGATAHFTAVFQHPSMTATGVAASFVKDR